MAQLKLDKLIVAVSELIGDSDNITYSTSEVLSAVNEARRKVYLETLTAFAAGNTEDSGTSKFLEIFPEWTKRTYFVITALVDNAGTLTATTDKPHGLTTGDSIYLSGVTGFGSNPSGIIAVTVTNSNQFTFAHAIASGSYTANSGNIFYAVVSNAIAKPTDCRAILSGLLTSATPSLTNLQCEVVPQVYYHEAKTNTYSPYYGSSSNGRLYQDQTKIEIMIGASISSLGRMELLYLAQPIDVAINANLSDIPDPELWFIPTAEMAAELLLSYQLT